MFVASLSLTVGAALGAVVGPTIGRALRWLASKTKTKRDDAVAKAVDDFMKAHPEVAQAVVDAVKRAVR